MPSISLLILWLLLVKTSSQFALFVNNDAFSCENAHGTCFLHNVQLKTEKDVEEAVFSNISDPLIIASGKIPHFTRILSDKLTNVMDLTINNLEIETLYVKPEMTHLQAIGNQINEILVDNDQNKAYEILSLDLSQNNLRNVQVLSRFTKLHQLTLDRNKLTELSMDLFNKMPELRKLSLADNQLAFDTSQKLHLLKLRTLSLAGNKLIELNIIDWDLPSLAELDVSRNNLYLLEWNLENFNALGHLRLSENNWKCDFLYEMIPKKIKLDRDNETLCNNMIVQHICCTVDASSILNEIESINYTNELKELQKLNESFYNFENQTKLKFQRLEEMHENRSIIERLEKAELALTDLQDKLSSLENLVPMKMDEVHSVIADYKHKIMKVEEKQSNMESELKSSVDSLNQILGKFDKLHKQIDEMNHNQKTLFDQKTQYINNTIKTVENQQIKYHISVLELKNQIVKERDRVTNVTTQLDKLKKDINIMSFQYQDVFEKTQAALNILEDLIIEPQ